MTPEQRAKLEEMANEQYGTSYMDDWIAFMNGAEAAFGMRDAEIAGLKEEGTIWLKDHKRELEALQRKHNDEVERLKEINRLLANKNADCELRIERARKEERERCAEIARNYRPSDVQRNLVDQILNPSESKEGA